MRRRTRWLLTTSALLALGAGAAVWHHKAGPYHFRTVTPGRLYRSGTLAPGDLEHVLARYGIRTVVSLRTEGEQRIGDWYEHERSLCAARGVELVSIPVDEPPSAEHIAQWLAITGDETRAPVLVHCKHGVVRTAVMVAIYEMEILGRDNRQVIDEVELFGRELDDPNRVHLRDFLLEYTPRSP